MLTTIIISVLATLVVAWLAINFSGFEINSTKELKTKAERAESEKGAAVTEAVKYSGKVAEEREYILKRTNKRLSDQNVGFAEQLALQEEKYESLLATAASEAEEMKENFATETRSINRKNTELQGDNKKLLTRINLLENNLSEATKAPSPVLKEVDTLVNEMTNAAEFSKQFPQKSKMAKVIKDRLVAAKEAPTA